MPEPCAQKDSIEAIKEAVNRSQALSEGLQRSIQGLTDEFRDIMKEMRELVAGDREDRERLKNVERSTEVLFKRVRRLEDEVIPGLKEEIRRDHDDVVDRIDDMTNKIMQKLDPVVEWKNQTEGKISSVKFIPIVCVIITTVLALSKYME